MANKESEDIALDSRQAGVNEQPTVVVLDEQTHLLGGPSNRRRSSGTLGASLSKRRLLPEHSEAKVSHYDYFAD